jgi:hypothetical protein
MIRDEAAADPLSAGVEWHEMMLTAKTSSGTLLSPNRWVQWHGRHTSMCDVPDHVADIALAPNSALSPTRHLGHLSEQKAK